MSETSSWTTEHVDHASSGLGDVAITLHSKSTSENTAIPKELYLTHMYRFSLKCSGSLATMDPLVAQITLINSATKEEITKDNLSTITGTTKTDIKNGEGTLKVKFTDTSYHHGKQDFALRITIHGSIGGTDLSLLMTKISNPFKVYSKKKRNNGSANVSIETINRPESEIGNILLQYIKDANSVSVQDRQLIRQLIVEKTPEPERKHFLTLVQPVSTASPIIPTPIRPTFQFGQTPSMFIAPTTHPPKIPEDKNDKSKY